jgi:hypothetical protein
MKGNNIIDLGIESYARGTPPSVASSSPPIGSSSLSEDFCVHAGGAWISLDGGGFFSSLFFSSWLR